MLAVCIFFRHQNILSLEFPIPASFGGIVGHVYMDNMFKLEVYTHKDIYHQ